MSERRGRSLRRCQPAPEIGLYRDGAGRRGRMDVLAVLTFFVCGMLSFEILILSIHLVVGHRWMSSLFPPVVSWR